MLDTLSKYWGYTSFRPFQKEAIESILEKRDTVTVLPTGGGKSVCFQLPALISEGMAVIISPLISLMKDQVDYLKDMGIPAESLNSSQAVKAQHSVIEKISSSNLKLLYLSPERLMIDQTLELLKSINVSFFVIDEAHCISHWGHNFRAEYRRLNLIKKEFPGISVHAFTATATDQVQNDIITQLGLIKPHIYVGSIDRPNLTYRVFPRSGNSIANIVDVIKKHPNEAGIIYCIRRSDVDEISQKLNTLGYRNLPYHAGLSDGERRKNQDEFSSESVPLIVATIAFGMGIDRSNIRYIIHAAMPKSIEHYQQETGRAGRDGLPSDCYLFYSGHDYRIWEYLTKDSSDREVLLSKLRAMYGFCVRPECRHRYLSNYFSQEYKTSNCGSCDYCLGEVDMVEEPLVIGQKIISCVARVKEKFGAGHVTEILQGNVTTAIERWGHEKLSTFSLMKDNTKLFIRFMIDQLIGQGFLRREGEFLTLAITEDGWKLLKGNAVPVLAKPIAAAKKHEIAKKQKLRKNVNREGLDENLFEELRTLRASIAKQKGVPAYVVFSDKTLIDMAQKKPVTSDQFSQIFGVGAAKLKEYSETFTSLIRSRHENPQ